jgi:hypothetical protein
LRFSIGSKRLHLIRTAGHSYIASVRAGVDGLAKAHELQDRLGLSLRHTYDDWFSFTTTSPSQLAQIEADEDITRLEINRSIEFDFGDIPPTIQMGEALDNWKLGMKYDAAPGLVRTEARPAAATNGCFGYPQTARWVDFYSHTRLSWQHGELINVATTERGARTAAGFAIGTATLPQVRAHFPSAKFFRQLPSSNPYWRSRYRLGRFLVAVTRPTGVEAWVSTYYWFDRQGMLVALETLKGGC